MCVFVHQASSYENDQAPHSSTHVERSALLYIPTRTHAFALVIESRCPASSADRRTSLHPSLSEPVSSAPLCHPRSLQSLLRTEHFCLLALPAAACLRLQLPTILLQHPSPFLFFLLAAGLTQPSRSLVAAAPCVCRVCCVCAWCFSRCREFRLCLLLGASHSTPSFYVR